MATNGLIGMNSHLYVDLRTEFGTLYEQDLFADLYADRGIPSRSRPGAWPW